MEHRSDLLSDVREMVGEVQAACDKIRQEYPLRYPVPPEIDAMLSLEESVIDRARRGQLKRATDILEGSNPTDRGGRAEINTRA